jgi:hypothetical protein
MSPQHRLALDLAGLTRHQRHLLATNVYFRIRLGRVRSLSSIARRHGEDV